MEQPPSFTDPNFSSYVCKLNKALYGLKQTPSVWFDKFSTFLISYGFLYSMVDPSLFIYHSFRCMLVLLLYVDDILLTGSNYAFLHKFTCTPGTQFAMKDLGPLHYFLGI